MYKDHVNRLIDADKYWGEFSEEKMDELLSIADTKEFEDVKKYIEDVLGRSDFIFGNARSDFLLYLPLDEESVVLDCGSGLGIHTFNAAKKVGHVHSFDQSLKRAQFTSYRKQAQQVENISVYQSDFKNLDFKENTFNSILMNGVVEWLGEIDSHKDPRDDQLEVLRQMHTYLKPEGVLYIGIENRMSASYLHGYDHNGLKFTSYFPRFLANIITKIRKGKSYRTYTYTYWGYKKLMKDAGFKEEDVTFYIAVPGYNLPKYIIPFDDIQAVRTFLEMMAQKGGIKGKLIKILSTPDFGVKIIRHLFFSYLIYAKK